MAVCRNHPERTAVGRCAGCAEEYCWPCMVELHGQKYCASCKMMALDGKVPAAVAAAREAWERPLAPANTSFATGIAAFLGGAVGCVACVTLIGLVCGIIAIVHGVNAKRILAQAPSRMASFKSTAGIVLGILGILMSLLFMAINVLSAAK